MRLTGADVLVDVTNSPSFEDDPVMEFFTTSTTNLSPPRRPPVSATTSRCRSSALDGLPDSGYMRAKVAQEKVHHRSGRAVHDCACHAVRRVHRRDHGSMTVGDEVRVPDALIQPIAAGQVAADVARAAVAEPLGGMREHRWAGEDLVRADGP